METSYQVVTITLSHPSTSYFVFETYSETQRQTSHHHPPRLIELADLRARGVAFEW